MKFLLDTNTCIIYMRVTHNTREFQRVNNLLIEDWEVDN